MRRTRAVAVLIVIASLAVGSPAALAAQPAGAAGPGRPPAADRVDRHLGQGLGRLLTGRSAAAARSGGKAPGRTAQEGLGITDARGRVLVHLTPQADENRTAFRAAAERAGLEVTATDDLHGTLEGFITRSAVRALAALPGTGTLVQALRPQTSVGSVTSQGVAFQRAGAVQAAGIDGSGITVGALSDSYDTATKTLTGAPLRIRAADDVASGDLPGPANPRNRAVVKVLEDFPGGEDEGRGMLQVVHDVAPGAALCFATAYTGTIGFAENIRRLADPAQCGADVIVDDITYFEEPFFSEGIIGDAVDDVTAAGVSYFSSVRNDGDKQAWRSALNLVSPAQALAGTNLDLTGVDPTLYDGGFQDFRPGPGVDAAQTLTYIDGGSLFNMQWDDPFDVDGTTYGAALFSSRGAVTAADPAPTVTFTPTAAQVGSLVEVRVDGVPSGSTDLVLTIRTPDGRVIGPIDANLSPETANTTLVAGTYTVTVKGFKGATGDFTLSVTPILSPSRVSTDLNALFFTESGRFLGAIADANRFTGRPIEIARLADIFDFDPEHERIQFAITRSGTGPAAATRVGYVLGAGLNVSEYWDPQAPATFGHHTAAGTTAVAATSPFPPFLPQYYTSPGGKLPIMFDSKGNRFPKPKIRKVPQISSTDGGNTTFYGYDSDQDADSAPNFFGTSASAPHAAAIAALLLDRAGGPRSLTPTQVRSRLQRSTFAHDLDPNRARGSARGLTITASGSQSSEWAADPGSMTDPRFFDLRYTGRVPVRSITFFGETASPTALTDGGVGGIVFDPRPFGPRPFADHGFPFTIGGLTGGLAASAVEASFSVPVPTGQFRRMTLNFTGDGLGRGEGLQFGVDRDLAVPGPGIEPSGGNGADELGGAVRIPERTTVRQGLKFVATRVDGSTFTGFLRNRIGTGWTPVDGTGVVDAERAVLGR